jgi:hypothetical protein
MEGMKETMHDLIWIADNLSDVRSRILPFTVQNFAASTTHSECPIIFVLFIKSTTVFPNDTQLNPGVPWHENKDITWPIHYNKKGQLNCVTIIFT